MYRYLCYGCLKFPARVYSDLLVRNAVGKKVGNPSITVYINIYAFLSRDSYCVREIKYLKFEPNVDVHFCLIPLPPFLRTSFMDVPLDLETLTCDFP